MGSKLLKAAFQVRMTVAVYLVILTSNDTLGTALGTSVIIIAVHKQYVHMHRSIHDLILENNLNYHIYHVA